MRLSSNTIHGDYDFTRFFGKPASVCYRGSAYWGAPKRMKYTRRKAK